MKVGEKVRLTRSFRMKGVQFEAGIVGRIIHTLEGLPFVRVEFEDRVGSFTTPRIFLAYE